MYSSKLKSLSLLFLFLSIKLNAQVILPHSTAVTDQRVLGPCYIFATVAALENLALKNTDNAYSPNITNSLDLYEWNLYSRHVIGFDAESSGHTMVKKVLSHVKEKGIYDDDDTPIDNYTLPNINDSSLPGIAYFPECENQFNNGDVTYLNPGGTNEQNCEDTEGLKFNLEYFTGNKFTYEYDDENGYVVDYSPTSEEMINHLNANRGLIAFFDNWEGEGAHGIFIFGYSGQDWKYKDSYPEDAGIKSTPLQIENCTAYYYLTGTVVKDNPSYNYCGLTIVGSNTVSNSTTYNLEYNYGLSVDWSVSDDLEIIHQNNYSIVVAPNSCGVGQEGKITASTSSNCEVIKHVMINGGSSVPSGIIVLSSNWNNNETCPNTILELNVADPEPNTIYNWSISGATILSGQGTDVVFVQTLSYNQNLNFKVRAKRKDCPFSKWRVLYGKSSLEKCGNNINGLKLYSNQGNIFINDKHSLFSYDKRVPLNYEIRSIYGSIVEAGKYNFDRGVDISYLKNNLYIIRFFNEKGFYHISKQVLVK